MSEKLDKSLCFLVNSISLFLWVWFACFIFLLIIGIYSGSFDLGSSVSVVSSSIPTVEYIPYNF